VQAAGRVILASNRDRRGRCTDRAYEDRGIARVGEGSNVIQIAGNLSRKQLGSRASRDTRVINNRPLRRYRRSSDLKQTSDGGVGGIKAPRVLSARCIDVSFRRQQVRAVAFENLPSVACVNHENSRRGEGAALEIVPPASERTRSGVIGPYACRALESPRGILSPARRARERERERERGGRESESDSTYNAYRRSIEDPRADRRGSGMSSESDHSGIRCLSLPA